MGRPEEMATEAKQPLDDAVNRGEVLIGDTAKRDD